jgi:hypothetical protein
MHTKKMRLKLLAPFLLSALALVSAFAAAPAAYAQQVRRIFDGNTPQFANLSHGAKLATGARSTLAASNQSSFVDTIPYWSDLFTSGGNPYPFQMVGTSPADGSQQTTVPTEIIPLKIEFSDGTVLYNASDTHSTVESPLFEKANYSSGYTQFGDAMQRAEFWQLLQHGGKNYHVWLKTPKVYSTITLEVPAADGFAATASRTGALVGLIDINWFDAELQSLMTQLHISPKTLPIFLSSNVFQYENSDPSQCCVIGYHNALFSTSSSGRSVIQTYAWASYTTPGIFSVPINDINALSHEVAEWYNDPFGDNVTPNWISPIAPQYGCNNFLEVGDPLVGVAFTVTTEGKQYHPQDIAFFSWFAKQTPSLGIHHQYTYLGTFTAAAPSC